MLGGCHITGWSFSILFCRALPLKVYEFALFDVIALFIELDITAFLGLQTSTSRKMFDQTFVLPFYLKIPIFKALFTKKGECRYSF